MKEQLYYAACAFGLESVVSRELEQLGITVEATKDARVYFRTDETGLALANICLRSADRVYMVLSEFSAVTFDELFEGVKRINFGAIIPPKANIPVAGDAVQSVLGSVSDVQAIVKKALIESMRRTYGNIVFDESKNVFQVYVNILRDQATVSINTSGAGLNRRGYRVKNSTA
ncbi:MAG: class I SAM-dependent RNA methyltransferase, partial [Eubacteriales bacterium]